MRLFLASYRLGDHADQLTALVPVSGAACRAGAGRVAVMANANDGQPPVVRDKLLALERALFERLGYEVHELDLRRWFGRDDLATGLSPYDLVWATGGNTFVLALAMKLSGFPTALRTLLDRDALAYGGYSAGAVIAGPTLHGVEHVDPPDELPLDYPSRELVWNGLQLVPYAIVPHWGGDYEEAARVPEMVATLEARGVAYRTLRDDQVIVVRT